MQGAYELKFIVTGSIPQFSHEIESDFYLSYKMKILCHIRVENNNCTVQYKDIQHVTGTRLSTNANFKYSYKLRFPLPHTTEGVSSINRALLVKLKFFPADCPGILFYQTRQFIPYNSRSV
jgi:hypothetical protein